MPCWTVHLGVAKKVNEVLKLNDDLFLFGSCMPDFVNFNISSRDISHYYNGKRFDSRRLRRIDFDEFLKDFKDKMDDPLILGYYVHLLTDDYFNDYIFNNSYVYDDNNKVVGYKNNEGIIFSISDYKEELRNIKQRDFQKYGNYLLNNGYVKFPFDYELIQEHVENNNISFLDKTMVKEKIEYLHSNDFLEYNSAIFDYCLFNKEDYDQVFNNCIEYILNTIELLK